MENKLYTHSEEISPCLAQAENLATTAVLSVFYLSISPFIPSPLILDPLLSDTHICRAVFY